MLHKPLVLLFVLFFLQSVVLFSQELRPIPNAPVHLQDLTVDELIDEIENMSLEDFFRFLGSGSYFADDPYVYQIPPEDIPNPYYFEERPIPDYPVYKYRDILQQGSLSVDGVIAYIRSQNTAVRRMDVEELVITYFNESAFEGVNHDIAIAQMLHATNFLKNEQRVRNHNYAGFVSNDIFPNMPTGVRAHIQHLKGYASTGSLNNPLVDPRFNILVQNSYRGRVQTFDQLFNYWTANPADYRNSINEILQWLYWYSDNTR